MNETIKKMLSHNGFQMAIVLGGLAITLVNMYIASQLNPLVSNIGSVATRVSAIEERNTKVDPLVERFIKVEANSIDDHSRLIRIEDKLDILLTK